MRSNYELFQRIFRGFYGTISNYSLLRVLDTLHALGLPPLLLFFAGGLVPPGLSLGLTPLAVRGSRVRVPREEPVLPPEGIGTEPLCSGVGLGSGVGLELLWGLGLEPPGVVIALPGPGAVELELGLLKLLMLPLGLLELELPGVVVARLSHCRPCCVSVTPSSCLISSSNACLASAANCETRRTARMRGTSSSRNQPVSWLLRRRCMVVFLPTQK